MKVLNRVHVSELTCVALWGSGQLSLTNTITLTEHVLFNGHVKIFCNYTGALRARVLIMTVIMITIIPRNICVAVWGIGGARE